jgi:hypothetical protein
MGTSSSTTVIDEALHDKVTAHVHKFIDEYCTVSPTHFVQADVLYYAFDIFMIKNMDKDWQDFKRTFHARRFLELVVRSKGGGCCNGSVFFGICLEQWVV